MTSTDHPAPVESAFQPPRRTGWRRLPVIIVTAAVWIMLVTVALGALPEQSSPTLVEGGVHMALDQPVRTFLGNQALGAGVDGLPKGDIEQAWTPSNLRAMRSTGFGPLSYRLRTELGSAAWHWNPRGTWSDPEQEEGYWTSSSVPEDDYGVSYGYRLPRRGNTIDQANDDGYSRIDDGVVETFWKSNPYLGSHFTGESDAGHPQWIMVAFPEPVPVNALRLAWSTPYATRFEVQYWTGEDAQFPIETGPVHWERFPAGVHRGAGGNQAVRLATEPIEIRHLRILMTESSGTAPPGSSDIRDRLGYAVRELYVGREDGHGFTDHLAHSPSKDQTVIWTSSTDPWHRATDLDEDYEHASFERVLASGLTNGQPLMVPVPVLFGTPEDAAALLRYLRARGYPVEQIEMGEEPNGQLTQPEDYGELYVQTARALKTVDPDVQFGGPGYHTSLPDWVAWPDARGVRSWTGRFVAYLRARDAMDDFDFFSFEWYPVDDVCADPAGSLAQHPDLLADVLRRQEEAGLPPGIPKVITEYGYSAFAGQPEVELPGAIVNAETAAHFLTLGGSVSYFYGYEPTWLYHEEEAEGCDAWGNLMLFQYHDDDQIRPIATYHAAQLLTQRWLEPGGGEHTVYRATTDIRDASGQPLVTAYPVRRPDGRLAVLLLNKDPERALTVRLQPLGGVFDVYQYSSEQYVWHPQGEDGYPEPNDPPSHRVLAPDAGAVVTLPPYSLTVVRTRDEL